jgi:hypothetical protein
MTNSNPQESKLEWQTPNLEIILSENTENGIAPGDDGSGIFTAS